MQWSKPGADPARVARDLDACRGQALAGATPPVFTSRSPDASADGRPAAMRPSASSNERFVEEHEVVRACMLRRGYELRPAG